MKIGNVIPNDVKGVVKVQVDSWKNTFLKASIVGVLFGILAQVFRQILGPLMYLGASTAPWVFIGFLLAFSASRGVYKLRKATLAATGSIATYLVAWLLSYHLLFVLRESVTLVDGWHQIAPWLFITIPVSPIIGTIAALSHKSGFLGDGSLAVPLAGSLTEAFDILKEGWVFGGVFMIPISIFAVLMLRMIMKERQVHWFTLLMSVLIMGALGIVLFLVVWHPILNSHL